ncbi:hypothetical protein O7626_00735 [Micromonospora sp. WMMD1102]|uniref:hypothetical protein n=1 Tax=Micromonospora sp. WMMD1102 TaxID=3016105 RepID=UPI002415315F|nr:hypothetical protein [Micromonospora sp. WMMD1102]MDG4784473.1 hypothetical protein [Micromonospora sp. WMMD1102]
MRSGLNEDHPYTLQCSVIAANVRFAAGDPAAALTTERQVYDAMGRIFREMHPDLLTAGCNLAASRTALGDVDGLVEFRADLLARASQSVGREHPLTAAILARGRSECEFDLLQF